MNTDPKNCFSVMFGKNSAPILGESEVGLWFTIKTDLTLSASNGLLMSWRLTSSQSAVAYLNTGLIPSISLVRTRRKKRWQTTWGWLSY
jgi:hypothetical protein